jgi:Family of unknown function (DUF6714)
VKPEFAQVCAQIREAFAGVELGSGVGMMQGQGLDDYADEETLAKLRAGDEKLDWNAISAESLNRCYSSLSFFDAEGMRFHLPAIMIAQLSGTLLVDPIFQLTQIDDYQRERFQLLSREQRSAVRAFLRTLSEDPDFQIQREAIVGAIEEYWSDVPEE